MELLALSLPSSQRFEKELPVRHFPDFSSEDILTTEDEERDEMTESFLYVDG